MPSFLARWIKSLGANQPQFLRSTSRPPADNSAAGPRGAVVSAVS